MDAERFDLPVDLVADEATARAALSPIRRRLLAAMAEPISAAGLSAALELPRQKIGYHLKILEEAGLIAEAGERKRRGFTERLFVARNRALIMDPMMLAADRKAIDAQDSHAAGHLIRAAAGIVREVARMQGEAAREGSRLITFTLEADVGFARPADLDRFTERLSSMLAELAREFAPAPGRRIYRITAGGHPAVRNEAEARSIN